MAANELLQLLTQLAPDLLPAQRAVLRKELQDHEQVFESPMPIQLHSIQERNALKRSFSVLKTALSE